MWPKVDPFEKLAIATLIAAIEVLSLVRERDGAAGRPATDVFEADEQPIIAAVSTSLEGSTARQKKPAHARAVWRMPHGSAPGSAVGPATMANQDRWSCCMACCGCRR